MLAAELLLDDGAQPVSPRVVSIESDERVSALDVARTIGELAGRRSSHAKCRAANGPRCCKARGLGEHHARLITDLYDAHNAGRIDVEAGISERRFGATTLAEVFAAIAAARGRRLLRHCHRQRSINRRDRMHTCPLLRASIDARKVAPETASNAVDTHEHARAPLAGRYRQVLRDG